MLHGYEQPTIIPSIDLYDSQMIGMHINALQKQYEQGQEEQKEFITKYGDFTSPSSADVELYDQYTLGKLNGAIDNLRANGIDPLRSQEGRAYIANVMRSVPYAKLANMRQSAKNLEAYNAAVAKATLDGTYNPDFERFAFNADPSQWNTEKSGIFNRLAPAKFTTLQEFVHPSFAGIKPHILSKEEVESRGYIYDPKYDYIGITRKDMEGTIRDWMPGVKGDPLYSYYRDQARQDLLRKGVVNPTESQIDAQFADNAITSDHQIMTPFDKQANPYAQLDYKDAIDDANAARDFNYDIRKMNYRPQAGGNGGERSATSSDNGGSFIERLIRENLSKNAGVNIQNYNPIELSRNNDAIQRKMIKAYGNDVLNHMFNKNVDSAEFQAYYGGAAYGKYGIYVSKNDISDVYSMPSLMSSMSGYHGKKHGTMNRKQLMNLAKDGKLVAKTTNRSATIKHGGYTGKEDNKYRSQLYFEVDLYELQQSENGTITEKPLGRYAMDSGAGTYPERGQYGTVENAAGQVVQRHRSNLTDTRDARASSSVRGEKKPSYNVRNNTNGM